jgi:hypothetical protein
MVSKRPVTSLSNLTGPHSRRSHWQQQVTTSTSTMCSSQTPVSRIIHRRPGVTANKSVASSFNIPFTTLNNYNWLFHLEQPSLTASNEVQTHANINFETEMGTLNGKGTRIEDNVTGSSISVTEMPTFATDAHDIDGPNTFQTGSQSSRESPSSIALPSPQSQVELSAQSGPRNSQQQEWGVVSGLENSSQSKTPIIRPKAQQQCLRQIPLSTNAEGWHSFMSKPSQQPLVLDDVSRNRVLDLVVQAGSKTPEGSPITHDHPLLTLEAMQEYTDLYFVRFNKS